jgi:hypothetical protein
MVIYNVPLDINVETLEETIMNLNPQLGLTPGDTVAKFRIEPNGDG